MKASSVGDARIEIAAPSDGTGRDALCSDCPSGADADTPREGARRPPSTRMMAGMTT